MKRLLVESILNKFILMTCILLNAFSIAFAQHENKVIRNGNALVPGISLGDFADDTAAAAGGVPLFGYYRTSNAVNQRIV